MPPKLSYFNVWLAQLHYTTAADEPATKQLLLPTCVLLCVDNASVYVCRSQSALTSVWDELAVLDQILCRSVMQCLIDVQTASLKVTLSHRQPMKSSENMSDLVTTPGARDRGVNVCRRSLTMMLLMSQWSVHVIVVNSLCRRPGLLVPDHSLQLAVGLSHRTLHARRTQQSRRRCTGDNCKLGN